MERTHMAINQLVDRIDRGEIKLPEIQRGYVWKPTQVAALVESIYRGYPSGSMLLWRPNEDVLGRSVQIEQSGVGPLATPQYLLDGQQRLTSLHRLFKGHPDAKVVFNVKTERFQVQSAATAKSPLYVFVVDVLDADRPSVIRRKVCEAAPDLDEDEVDERLGRLRAISKHEYYLETLTDLTYRDVADVFVRVNSKGRALKTVDLTLAVLSAEWPGVVAKLEAEIAHWKSQGWRKIDDAFLMRSLAATATDAATLGRLPDTSTADLEAGWEVVKRGIRHLVLLLADADIRTSNLIPSMNALVPLVVLLGRHDGKQQFTDADAVVYWLLAVFVTSRYSSAADTKIAQDSLAARKPDAIREMYASAGVMGSPMTITEPQLLGRGSTSPLFLLSYLAAKSAQAKDWWHDVEISETGAGGGFSIEYHHVHPQVTLRDSYSKAEINDLANLAFISATANKKISGRSPADYFPELLVKRDELSPHFVPTDAGLRTADVYREFLGRRRKLLAEAMTAVMNARRPSWVGQAAPAATVEDSRAVSLTLTGEVDPVLVFEAELGEERWSASAPLADVERYLTEASDGLASSLQLGPELAEIQPGAEEIMIPVGPFAVLGSAEDWDAVLTREKADPRAGHEPTAQVAELPYPSDRLPFPVLETD